MKKIELGGGNFLIGIEVQPLPTVTFEKLSRSMRVGKWVNTKPTRADFQIEFSGVESLNLLIMQLENLKNAVRHQQEGESNE